MLQKMLHQIGYWPILFKEPGQWSIILGAGLYTTCCGERVSAVIRFNTTFLLLRLIVKKYVPLSWTMQKV